MKIGYKRMIKEYLTPPEGLRLLHYLDSDIKENTDFIRARLKPHNWIDYGVNFRSSIEGAKYWREIHERLLSIEYR